MTSLAIPDLVPAYTEDPAEVKKILAFLHKACYHSVAVYDIVAGQIRDPYAVAAAWDAVADAGLEVILTRSGLECLSPLQRREFFERLGTYGRQPFLHICDEGEIVPPYERRLLLALTDFPRQCLGPGTSLEWTFQSAAIFDGTRLVMQ